MIITQISMNTGIRAGCRPVLPCWLAFIAVLLVALPVIAAVPKQIRHHEVRVEGRYPEARVVLDLTLQARNTLMQIEATVRDRDQNQVVRKTEQLHLENEAEAITMDLTPPQRSVGPFSVEYRIRSQDDSMHFVHEQRFAFANARIPFTSMQSDRLPHWFWSTYESPVKFQRYSLTLNNQDVIKPADFDTETFRSGNRSLHFPYRAGRQTHLYSNLALPGFPLRAYVWVKGNQSEDELRVSFRDRCETARWAHERYVNTRHVTVCKLDFEGWRQFEVPVLGEGLQTDSRHAEEQAVATPIYMLAFSIHARGPVEGESAERMIWLDDLVIESQVRKEEQVSVELRTDRADGLLHAEGTIRVAIGNGTGAPVTEGRLSLSARDRNGNEVYEHTQSFAVGIQDFTFMDIPMVGLATADPAGPVTVETIVIVPEAGVRTRESLVLKFPGHAAVFWDFENEETYSGFYGRAGASTVAGGVAGSGRSLAIDVSPETTNSVVLHPALPGTVSHIDMMIKGGAEPVRLQPVFLDSGRTGVAGMDYNRFHTPEILVDWQEWRRVTIAAPAIPVGYDDYEIPLLFEAAHPLNLELTVRAAGEKPARISVDHITVHTHLDDEDAITIQIDGLGPTGVLPPDSPLNMRLMNFHRDTREVALDVELRDGHDRVLISETRSVKLPPGKATLHVLHDRLPQGVYMLEIVGIGQQPLRQSLVSMDLTRYFGDEPESMLRELPLLEQQLDMLTRRIYLDWDNMEMMPGLFHYDWFHNEIEKASAGGTYKVVPILGFAADWAGPEKWEAVKEKSYERFIGSHMQLPVRLTDWSRYVRAAVREYAGRVAAWEFWENPDHRGSPAYIPPERYAEMLAVVKRWVQLHDPGTPVIAAGFSIDHVYSYLNSIGNPHDLEFDKLGIQFSIGELSPEAADMEGLLDDLNQLLKLDENSRTVDIPQLDWAVDDLVTPVLQGAYHARASLIMHRRHDDSSYRFRLVNDGSTFNGYGLFYRKPYGNTPNIQGLKPVYIPKPALFALAGTRARIQGSRFLSSVRIPDRDVTRNYAYLYRRPDGLMMAAVWRAYGDSRAYRMPAAWTDASMVDAFDIPVTPSDNILRLGEVPLFIIFPKDYKEVALRHDFRVLEPADGRDHVVMALVVSEPDSASRADYVASGEVNSVVYRDRGLLGGHAIESVFLEGLETEQFSFSVDVPGLYLLTRTWHSDDGETGSRMELQLNDAPPQIWDLSFSEAARQMRQAGIRETSFLLSNVSAGRNTLTVRHTEPGNSARWIIEPVPEGFLDLAYWGALNTLQAKGYPLRSTSAMGTPLKIGSLEFATGIGTVAPAYLEFPLQGQFDRFEVTVGIDAAAKGRGSVIFSVFADGEQVAVSETMTGFSDPVTLKVEALGTVRRLALRVKNVGTGSGDGFANWMDAKLFPRTLAE